MREKGFSQPELQRIFNIIGEDKKYVNGKKIKIITVDPEVRDVFTRNSSQNAFSELQKNVIVVTGIPPPILTHSGPLLEKLCPH